jgi:hypothetical protein
MAAPVRSLPSTCGLHKPVTVENAGLRDRALTLLVAHRGDADRLPQPSGAYFLAQAPALAAVMRNCCVPGFLGLVFTSGLAEPTAACVVMPPR